MYFTPLREDHAYKWDVCLLDLFASLSVCVLLENSLLRWCSSTTDDGGGSRVSWNTFRQHPHWRTPPPPPADCPWSRSPALSPLLLSCFPVLNLSQGSYTNKPCALSSLARIRLIDMYNNITSLVYPPHVWFRLLLSPRSSNQKWAVWVTVPLYEMERGSAHFH